MGLHFAGGNPPLASIGDVFASLVQYVFMFPENQGIGARGQLCSSLYQLIQFCAERVGPHLLIIFLVVKCRSFRNFTVLLSIIAFANWDVASSVFPGTFSGMTS